MFTKLFVKSTMNDFNCLKAQLFSIVIHPPVKLKQKGYIKSFKIVVFFLWIGNKF